MSFTSIEGDKLRCELCPHRCLIAEGRSGICNVRWNEGGGLALPLYGVLSAVSTDPIEKKPLYHFYPGSSSFSVGFYGCSFRCPFCQNYRIAQHVPRSGGRGNTTSGPKAARSVSPKELVENALREGAESIAYTYSEPLVHFEWVRETAEIARERGLFNVLVSNGYLNREPALELLPLIDAANIDLKSFRQEYYRRTIGGDLQPVLDFIRLAAVHSHVEVTTLVIPGETDSTVEISAIAGFLAEIDVNIPFHLSCYHPAHNYHTPATDPQSVFALAGAAKKQLRCVYPGNVGLTEVNTECAACKNILVRRSGYRVRMPGIVTCAEGGPAVCRSCGEPVPFPV